MRDRSPDDAPTEGRIEALAEEDLGREVERIDATPLGGSAVYVLELAGSGPPDRAVLKYCIADDSGGFLVEPKLLEFFGEGTDVPVPTVYAKGFDGDCPYMFVEYCERMDISYDLSLFPPGTQRTLAEEAGSHLAEIHAARTFDDHGTLTVADDEIVLAETFETTSGFLLDYLENMWIDGLPDAFADLDIREPVERVARSVPGMTPVLVHGDYNVQNVAIDPERHTTTAIFDWGAAMAAPAEFDLVRTEAMLCRHGPLDLPLRRRVREGLLAGYGAAPGTYYEWREELMLVNRIGPMAMLPMWYRNVSAEARAAKAEDHREAVRELLESISV